MLRIKMLKTVDGAVNGIHVKKFHENELHKVDGYDIDKDLAGAWVANGTAEIFDEEVAPKAKEPVEEAPAEEKAVAPDLENKAVTPATKKKSK